MAQAAQMGFREAMDVLSREERFMGMVSAMNTVLIQKGVYTREELEAYFCQWAEAQKSVPQADRPGWSRSKWLSRISAALTAAIACF